MALVPQKWFYPADIASDLQGVDLPEELKPEILACAWEYARCVIPQYTNWNRYVAFMRIVVMGVVAEFRGSMVDVVKSDQILGYSVDQTLASLFDGTIYHEAMAREYKAFLLITSDKTSARRSGELFRRYGNALAASPKTWFRMRDCDALARFTMAAALACNDMNAWYSEEQIEVLAEIGITLYDAIAFYKHRTEGETNSTFAYMPEDSRVEAFRLAREVLWALDVSSADKPAGQVVVNFLRFFGGPIHMMMRRYRFTEEGLTIGRVESERVVQQTRQNFKLWNRLDAADDRKLHDDRGRYLEVMAREEDLLFPGLAGILESLGDGRCSQCLSLSVFGTDSVKEFGGVSLCGSCQENWRAFSISLPERLGSAFPQIRDLLNQ